MAAGRSPSTSVERHPPRHQSAPLAIKNGTFSLGGGAHAVQGLTVDAVLKGEQLTVSRISGNVATGGIVGNFSASGSARLPELTLAAADGSLVLDTAKFTFSGIPVEQRRPSRFELSKGTLTIADATWSVAENPLVFAGTIGVAAEDPPLNLSLKGLVDLRILSALVSTVAFDGNANINTLIEGTVSKPLLDGRIVLDDAEIAVAEPRVVLSELSGPIVLDGNLAIFDGVRGLANGGALALDGRFEFDGLHAQRRRAEHPGAGCGAGDAARPAQRARRAGDLPARSAEPVADRRHPHRAVAPTPRPSRSRRWRARRRCR